MKIIRFGLLMSLISLGAACITARAEMWLDPKMNRAATLRSDADFVRFQKLSLMIWQHASRDFLFREISPEPEYADNTARVSAIIGNHEIGFKKEVVKFVWKEDGWIVGEKSTVPAKEAEAIKAYEIVKANLLKARHNDSRVKMAVDFTPSVFECLQFVDAEIVLQGVENDLPPGGPLREDCSFVIEVLR